MEKVKKTIEVKHLKKSFHDKAVLKDVNFDVMEGTIFCLLGSNGAGKTTTIRILSTLLAQDEGNATICGHDIKNEGAKVRSVISLTGQFSAIDEILTAKENMELVARLTHIEDYKQRSIDLLKQFHLDDVADKRVETFSGGMKRRLDIAMSLIGQPQVVFLDEPTTGLDPQSRNAMWEIIRRLKESGVTIFLTTQYLEEAEQLADTVAILHEGSIVANGSVNDLKKISENEYMELVFHNMNDYTKAKELLQTFLYSEDIENLIISIELQQGVSQLIDIFSIIKDNQLRPASFIQKKATLEDVFLHLVEQKEVISHG